MDSKRDSNKCQECEYWSDKCREINRQHQGIHMNGESLCWCCKNAIPSEDSGCEWSVSKKPVKGWEVSQSKLFITNDGKQAYTYRVDRCPKFERG